MPEPPDSEIECSLLGDENLNDVLTWIEICHRSHQIDLPWWKPWSKDIPKWAPYVKHNNLLFKI